MHSKMSLKPEQVPVVVAGKDKQAGFLS